MSEDKSKESLRIKFNQYLEENKLRKTTERYFVLDVISETSKKIDAEYVYSEVLSRGNRISRATVYNTLSALVEAQILREHEIEGKKYFEKAPLAQVYVRLICTKCGKIKDVKDAETISTVNSKKYGRFLTSYSTIAIYGLCSKCNRTQKRRRQKKR